VTYFNPWICLCSPFVYYKSFFAIGTRWIMHCFSFWFSTKDRANFVWDLEGGLGPICLVWSWTKFVNH
jgi:hypothetical protein